MMAGILSLEFLVHAWDYAAAVGREVNAPDSLTDYVMGLARKIITPRGPQQGRLRRSDRGARRRRLVGAAAGVHRPPARRALSDTLGDNGGGAVDTDREQQRGKRAGRA